MFPDDEPGRGLRFRVAGNPVSAPAKHDFILSPCARQSSLGGSDKQAVDHWTLEFVPHFGPAGCVLQVDRGPVQLSPARWLIASRDFKAVLQARPLQGRAATLSKQGHPHGKTHERCSLVATATLSKLGIPLCQLFQDFHASTRDGITTNNIHFTSSRDLE